MYGLRKIKKDGTNEYNNFVWPLTVGTEVEAPDWNPEPKCGGGLHCLPNANGNWWLLEGEYWAVLEFDEKDMVQIDNEKCKVKKCKIVFLSENPEGMLKFFDVSKFDSHSAYYWTFRIGNRDIMIDCVKKARWAMLWAYFIGDKEVMFQRFPELKTWGI
jgi:hypothetical protein